MPMCKTCGEKFGPYAALCHMCGTPVPGAAPPPQAEESSTPSGKLCPGCGKFYPADYADSFCECGIELAAGPAPSAAVDSLETVLPDRPAPGTPCLVLFGVDKQPLAYFPLTKDATLIGRLDAVAGIFPDVDVTEFLDQSQARKVSRQHALILRSRNTSNFCLRPLAGNTGTQLESDMLAALQDHPLKTGARMVLGGSVRLKFEIMA